MKKMSLYFYTLPFEGMTCADVDYDTDSGDNSGINEACSSIEEEVISSGCLEDF